MSHSRRLQKQAQPAVQPGTPSQASVVLHEQAQVFFGPLPPPGVLEGYNRAAPDAASRIIAMAEREQRARHLDHHLYVGAKVFSEVLGAVTGFILPAGGLYLAYRLGVAGMNGASIAAVLGAVGILGARIALAWRAAKKDNKPQQLDLPLDK